MKRVLPVPLAGAAATAWAAVPTGRAGGWGMFLLVVACLAVAAGTARVAFLSRPRAPGLLLPGVLDRLGEWLSTLVRGLEWEVVASVSLVVLEVLHPSRPWHTGVLGLLVTIYLLAVRRAEAVVAQGALRSQARLAGAGLALLALVAGLALLPTGGGGTVSACLEVVGALAAVAAAAMALPAS